jgi:hypothetical protein
MGADVIYTYRKLMPRMFIALMLWIASLFAVFFIAGDATTSLFWFIGSFLVVFAYIGLEFLHAYTLVKGSIENVPTSNLTKAIFWLSIAGSGRVISSEYQYYCRHVTKTIDKMDDASKNNWMKLSEKYALRNLIHPLYMLGGIMGSLFGSVIGEFLKIEPLSAGFIALTLFLFISYAVKYKKGRENVELLAKDAEAVKMSRLLAQQLILWTSEHAKKPLQIMLAQDDYSNIKVVGSVYGSTIAVIEPKTMLSKEEAE